MLLCVSASHKTASFELLERLSVPSIPVAPLIAAHSECVQGAVVVATCNRFEAYVDMDEPVTAASALGLEAALTAIETATGVPAAELEGSYRVMGGAEVAEHLFAVASGLESVVVGEGEIAGQVRRALVESRALGTVSGELERLFQRASEAQRGVKNATALGRAGRSLVRLALDLADSRIADWAALRVLIVGTGAYAAATLAALRERGAQDVSVYSPSARTAFAAKHGLPQVAPERFPSAVAHADLVITCTTAEHHVISAATFAAGYGAYDTAVAGRAASGCPVDHGGARRLVVDLGLPRNVDPDVATVPGVDLLDLETIRLHAPLEELQATDAAREVVRDAARRFAVVGERKSLAPAVVALRTHVFGMLEAEISRARARGDDGRTEQALRHLVGVLLHTPTTRAHQLADDGRADDYLAALSTLFGLEVADADEQASDEASGAA